MSLKNYEKNNNSQSLASREKLLPNEGLGTQLSDIMTV